MKDGCDHGIGRKVGQTCAAGAALEKIDRWGRRGQIELDLHPVVPRRIFSHCPSADLRALHITD